MYGFVRLSAFGGPNEPAVFVRTWRPITRTAQPRWHQEGRHNDVIKIKTFKTHQWRVKSKVYIRSELSIVGLAWWCLGCALRERERVNPLQFFAFPTRSPTCARSISQLTWCNWFRHFFMWRHIATSTPRELVAYSCAYVRGKNGLWDNNCDICCSALNFFCPDLIPWGVRSWIAHKINMLARV